jgi:hypothetical protein
MSGTKLFLTPCSKQQGDARAYGHLQETVLNQIPRSRYSKYTSKNLGDTISIWGATDGTKGTWNQLDEGDYLLFYIGDETYRYAAQVIDKEENLDLANELWPDFATTTTGGDDPHEPWRWIIYIDDPLEIDVDGSEVHGFADHQLNYTYRFMRLNDQAHQKIRERFDDVESYLRERAEEEMQQRTEGDDASENSSSGGMVDREEAVSDLRPPKRTNAQVSRIIRNTNLVRTLKESYDFRCQVCNDKRKRSKSEPYAEGHHLQPLGDSQPGPDTEENILILCPNHHADFDYGLIRVDPDTLEIAHLYDDSADGEHLHVRKDHDLSEKYLKYHNQKSKL